MSLTPAESELLKDAAATLDGAAHDLRYTYTIPPDHQEWHGDCEEERAAHDRMKALVPKLYALAERADCTSAVTP